VSDSIPAWVQDAVFYEIFPERFANGDPRNDPPGVQPWDAEPTPGNFLGGDLQGILGKLDYLQALGVTALYLTPIFAADTNHKYDTLDYQCIDPHFGDMDIFRRLLAELHARGMRLVLDAVFNHVGKSHWAFRDVMQRGEDSPYVNWFYIEDLPVTTTPAPNYATYENASYLVKLNIHNPQVRTCLYDVARKWTREGIDGWRLDVPYLMNHRFWKGFRRVVREINPEAYIVAEVWQRATDWLQGDECDGAMNYRLRDLMLQFFVQERLDAQAFARELAALGGELPGRSSYAMLNLLGSHDTPRILTLCGGDKARTELAVTFLFTHTGVPMVYYGDEVGMLGENDPGCRRGMWWEPSRQDAELLDWHRRCARLRLAHPALRRGSERSLHAHGHVYAFERDDGHDRVVLILNRATSTETVPLPEDCWQGRDELRDELGGGVVRRAESVQIAPRAAMALAAAAT